MYHWLESAMRTEQLRAPRWIAQARDFAQKMALQTKRWAAVSYQARRPVVPQVSAPEVLASSQTAEQAVQSLEALVRVLGA
jgi:hypothetical protein